MNGARSVCTAPEVKQSASRTLAGILRRVTSRGQFICARGRRLSGRERTICPNDPMAWARCGVGRYGLGLLLITTQLGCSTGMRKYHEFPVTP